MSTYPLSEDHHPQIIRGMDKKKRGQKLTIGVQII